MSRAARFIWREMRELAPVALFFFLLLSFRDLIDALLYGRLGISAIRFTTLVVWSLIIGKVVLLTDLLPFVRSLNRKTLFYETVAKTLVYSAAGLLYRVLDHVIHALRRHEGWPGAWHSVQQALSSPSFWGLQLFFTVGVGAFVAGRGLIRASGGAHAMRRFFFEPRRPPPTHV